MGQGKDTMKRSRRAATEAEKAFKAAEKERKKQHASQSAQRKFLARMVPPHGALKNLTK